VVDDVEPLLALRIIYARNIDDRDELSRRIVAQELKRFYDAGGIEGQRQFAKREIGVEDRARQRIDAGVDAVTARLAQAYRPGA